MGGLAPEGEIAEIVAIEWRAPAGQVLDAGRGFGGDALGDAMVDNAGASYLRVLGMGVGVVAFTHGGGHTTLRPGRGCAGAQGFGGKHGNGTRRQLERGEKSGQTGPDHQCAVGIERVVESGHAILPATDRAVASSKVG